MIKVLFLIKSEKTPSSRIRIRNLISFLEARDISSEVIPIPRDLFSKLKIFSYSKNFDITILQKRLLPLPELKILQAFANCLGFDFDDAIYCKNASCSPNPSDYYSKTRYIKFKNTINASHFVVAANRELANKATEIKSNIPIIVLPSPIPVENLPVKKSYKLSQPPILGWVGSESTLRYLYYISDSLRRLATRQKFILHIIADKYYSIPGLNCKFTKWSLSTQDNSIPLFDIGLMPLSDDPFSRGKAAYKLLQYMAAGVPSVASGVGMNIEVADDNKACILADSPEEFPEKISLLLGSEELRKQMGLYARKKVSEKYSCKVIGEKFADVLKKIKKNIYMNNAF